MLNHSWPTVVLHTYSRQIEGHGKISRMPNFLMGKHRNQRYYPPKWWIFSGEIHIESNNITHRPESNSKFSMVWPLLILLPSFPSISSNLHSYLITKIQCAISRHLGRGFNPFHTLNSKRTQHADFRNTAAAAATWKKTLEIPYSFMKFLVGWGSTIFIPDSSGVAKSTERTRDLFVRGTICQSTCNWKALQTKRLYVFSKQ